MENIVSVNDFEAYLELNKNDFLSGFKGIININYLIFFILTLL